jgi:hypothetical protein
MTDVAATIGEFVAEGKVRFVGGSNIEPASIPGF